MKLTIIGATGSMSGPQSPASSYLVTAWGKDPKSTSPRRYSVVLDMGPGAFGALWHHLDPCDLDALFLSHCHADHMGDIVSMQVYRKWGPARGSAPLPVYSPDGTLGRVRQIEGAVALENYDQEFSFVSLKPGMDMRVGPMRLRAYSALHPVEAYGVRIEGPSHLDPTRTVSIFYTGDTDVCDSIVEGARGVDLLLSEVGFTSKETVRDMHMDGARAGSVARRAGVGRMVATHIQPWTPHSIVEAEVRSTWSGPLDFAQADRVFEL